MDKADLLESAEGGDGFAVNAPAGGSGGDGGGADESGVVVRGHHRSSRERREAEFRDPFWGVVFVIHVCLIAGLGLGLGIGALTADKPDFKDVDDDPDDVSAGKGPRFGHVLVALLVVAVVCTLCAALWVKLMLEVAGSLIVFALAAVGTWFFLAGVVLLAEGEIPAGIVMVLVALLVVGYYYVIRNRIEFATANLKIACAAVRSMPSTILYAIILLLAQGLWVILWGLAVLGVATNNRKDEFTADGKTYDVDDCTSYTYSDSLTLVTGPEVNGTATTTTLKCDDDDDTCHACYCGDTIVYDDDPCVKYHVRAGLYIVLLLSLYWGCTTISNIVHCTVAGAVGSWWFREDPGQRPVREAFGRATTWSLGSIALGSLLVAIVRTTRYVFAEMRKTSSQRCAFLLCCIDFFLDFLDRIVEIFNRYAFCYVALYGNTFWQAGRSVSELFQQRGWTAIINDDLIDNVLSLGALVIAVVGALVGFALAKAADLNTESTALVLSLGAFIGYALCTVTLTTISSAVATVFVCFAEDPSPFRRVHPHLYEPLMAAWAKFYPEEMECCGYAQREPSGERHNDANPADSMKLT